MFMFMTHRCEWAEYTVRTAQQSALVKELLNLRVPQKAECCDTAKGYNAIERTLLRGPRQILCNIFQVHVAQIVVTVHIRGLKTASPVFIHSFIHSFISIQPLGRFSRNQNSVRRPVWLWHTASWASSQGQVAIAFPRLQTFPLSPLGAFTSNDARDLQQRKLDLFVGKKCSDKFRLEFDFHVILEIFYMPQICDIGQTALRPLRRKAC